jgi:hypothetical protein
VLMWLPCYLAEFRVHLSTQTVKHRYRSEWKEHM